MHVWEMTKMLPRNSINRGHEERLWWWGLVYRQDYLHAWSCEDCPTSPEGDWNLELIFAWIELCWEGFPQVKMWSQVDFMSLLLHFQKQVRLHDEDSLTTVGTRCSRLLKWPLCSVWALFFVSSMLFWAEDLTHDGRNGPFWNDDSLVGKWIVDTNDFNDDRWTMTR